MILSIFTFFASPTAAAEESDLRANNGEAQVYTLPTGTFIYRPPSLGQLFQGLRDDWGHAYDLARQDEAVPYLWAIGISSALGIAYDQVLLDEAVRQAKRWGLPQEDNTRESFQLLGLPVRLPTDVGSSMYFIGDGWLHGSLAASFFSYGWLSANNRAWQTGMQLAEALATTGIATQVLKHVTGRESPFTTDVDGGVWRFFPDQKAYHEDVPRYDAFPSGHMATSMMTVTVISMNYPEHVWIRPLGYTLMTALGFQMMNNGVHWFGDYPVALGLGYVLGRSAVERGRERLGAAPATTTAARTNSARTQNAWWPDAIYPVATRDGTALAARWRLP